MNLGIASAFAIVAGVALVVYAIAVALPAVVAILTRGVLLKIRKGR